MADNRLTVYGSIATVLDTGLNSLAASTGKQISSALDNSSDLYLWDDLELVVTYGSAPAAANALVELYQIVSVDGTNYGDGGTSVTPPPSSLVGVFPLRLVTTGQRITLRGVPLPPGLFKYLVQNKASQGMASSGNTLKRRPYGTKSV